MTYQSPELFGFFARTHSDAPHPQQVGESNTLTLRNPKEPFYFVLYTFDRMDYVEWASLVQMRDNLQKRLRLLTHKIQA